ncbi:MAG TPA: YdcF family protein [Steroidobacteraceae bacterium]|nr:YdcF family protein [Steroidobacteraceae bacterium]
MLITLKSLLHTLLLPPGGPLLLATAGAWLLARQSAGRRARRTGWALLIGGLATLWLLSNPLVARALARTAQRCPPLDLRQALQGQAIVILGGDAERIGAPEYGGEPAVALRLLERVDYGAYVARRTGLPIAVSGTADEARAMRAALARDFGVDTRWTEERSRDTFENAQYSAQLLRPLGIRRIVLVTDAEHEWRALQEFRGAGFEVVPAPVGLAVHHTITVHSFIPTPQALVTSTGALYELLGDLARRTLAVLHLRRQASPR